MTDGAGFTAEDSQLVTLGRLTRGALHELANPLLALVGTADFALMEAEPGTALHDRISTMHTTALEIAGIVRALQAFARQRHEPARRFGLVDAAGDAVGLVSLVAAAPDVEISTRADARPRVHEAPGAVAGALVELLLDRLAAEDRGRTIVLVVREDGGEAVAAVEGGGEIRFARVGDAA